MSHPSRSQVYDPYECSGSSTTLSTETSSSQPQVRGVHFIDPPLVEEGRKERDLSHMKRLTDSEAGEELNDSDDDRRDLERARKRREENIRKKEEKDRKYEEIHQRQVEEQEHKAKKVREEAKKARREARKKQQEDEASAKSGQSSKSRGKEKERLPTIEEKASTSHITDERWGNN